MPPSALALPSTSDFPERYDTRLKFYQTLSQKMEMNANGTLEGIIARIAIEGPKRVVLFRLAHF
jgi:hypothetical protein